MSLTIIIPNDSGPKASSRVEKETFPSREVSTFPLSRHQVASPFLRSSRVTVTAAADILILEILKFKVLYENSKIDQFHARESFVKPRVRNLEGRICRASPSFELPF